MTVEISHVLPGQGLKHIPLFGISSMVYEMLEASGEILRLKGLRHIGALSHVYPGVVHSRWDYTLQSVFIASYLPHVGINSNSPLIQGRKDSYRAMAQALLLAGSTGHLAGTFSVERGVYRYLMQANPSNPFKSLATGATASQYVHEFYLLVAQKDHYHLHRALSLLKMFGIVNDEVSSGHEVFLRHLLLPYYCPSHRSALDAWKKIDSFLRICRKLSSLSFDSQYSSLPFVNIASLISYIAPEPSVRPQDIARAIVTRLPVNSSSTQDITDAIQALLKTSAQGERRVAETYRIIEAYNRYIYGEIYDSERSRAYAALVADSIFNQLSASVDPTAKILDLLYNSDTEQLIGSIHADIHGDTYSSRVGCTYLLTKAGTRHSARNGPGPVRPRAP